MMTRLIEESVALLRQMVTIPSVTFDEEAVSQMVAAQLEAWGISCQRYHNNIVALGAHNTPDRPTLLLCAHLDTVPANAGYTRQPHDPGEDVDIVWGLGSNDDGGSVAAMIAVFRALYQREDLPVNLLLGLSAEEEKSGPHGAQYLWAEVFGQNGLPRPDMAIIGEPTGCRAATSERGLLVIDGEAHGVSGHAARGEGINALYHALRDIEMLQNFSFDRLSPTMGNVKLSVTQIEAGTAHNVIPDRCLFVVDIRPTDQYDNAEILAMLQDAIHDEEREALGLATVLKARNLANRSNATPEDHPLLKAVRQLGFETFSHPLLKAVRQLGFETFSSPTTSDWIRTLCPAIKMGPGESCRSHRPDEFIKVAEIEQAAAVYERLILSL